MLSWAFALHVKTQIQSLKVRFALQNSMNGENRATD
jgi:hypothetical protein